MTDPSRPSCDPPDLCSVCLQLVPAAHGRASPAYDLGYHTLVARPSAPSPRQQPSPWGGEPPQTAACYPAAALPSYSVREPPRPPQLPEPPSSNELILTMFKGKRTHKPAPFDRLSDELILHIFSYLSTNELCYCARVCRRWYFLVWEPQLWTSITLTGETTGADRALRQIVKLLCRDTPGTLCHTVERVELNGCARLTDRGLSLLARRCPELRHLELRGCANVSNQALFEVVTNCAGLEHLDVTGERRGQCAVGREVGVGGGGCVDAPCGRGRWGARERERERQRERETERQRDRERDRETETEKQRKNH